MLFSDHVDLLLLMLHHQHHLLVVLLECLLLHQNDLLVVDILLFGRHACKLFLAQSSLHSRHSGCSCGHARHHTRHHSRHHTGHHSRHHTGHSHWGRLINLSILGSHICGWRLRSFIKLNLFFVLFLFAFLVLLWLGWLLHHDSRIFSRNRLNFFVFHWLRFFLLIFNCR